MKASRHTYRGRLAAGQRGRVQSRRTRGRPEMDYEFPRPPGSFLRLARRLDRLVRRGRLLVWDDFRDFDGTELVMIRGYAGPELRQLRDELAGGMR